MGEEFAQNREELTLNKVPFVSVKSDAAAAARLTEDLIQKEAIRNGGNLSSYRHYEAVANTS